LIRASQISNLDQIQGSQSWVKRHPLLSFFTVTFLISWATWLLAPTISNGDVSLQVLLDLTGAFAPALSAILISSMLGSEPSGSSGRKRVITFSAVFVVSLLMQIYAYIFLTGINDYSLVLVSFINSIIAAYVVSSVYHPRMGVVKLMAGLKLVSGKHAWILVGLVLPFAFPIISEVAWWALGSKDIFNLTSATLAIVLINYPFTMLFGGPLNEEPGWRGFVVPKMEIKHSALITGLVIGAVWSVWHLPLHVTGFYGGGVYGFIVRFTWNIPLGVLMTWLYNRSGGSILTCVLMHTGFNDSTQLFPSSIVQQTAILVMITFTALVVLYDKMYRRMGVTDAGGYPLYEGVPKNES
jgi:membrane protease YdiL (CAAX protease family)